MRNLLSKRNSGFSIRHYGVEFITLFSAIGIRSCFWFLLIGSALQAVESPEPLEQPWLTGSLLSSFGYVIEQGHVSFEPYFYGNTAYGMYDKSWHERSQTNRYALSNQLFFWYGFAPHFDIEISPQFSWNHVHGASHWVLNDIPIALEFQILYQETNKWWPAIKLAFLCTLPVGKYQKLKSNARGTDGGGEGNWQSGIELVLERLFKFTKPHDLVTHFTLSYNQPNAVHVKGINVFGGGKGTRGKVYPGPYLLAILGWEYTLTRNWALALDIEYLHTDHTRFSGKKGSTQGKKNQVGLPSSEQFSLAPAIEYNWSAHFGIISGVWFSIAGRNTAAFANGIIAVSFYW